MQPSIHLSALRDIRWYEFALRFLFGGTITVVAGLIASGYGPAVGGLLLAFPAILPASVTLVEKHEREKKTAGAAHKRRGREAAALDAYGAALGAPGLFSFALVVWLLLPKKDWAVVLVLATIAWCAVSVALWRFRKSPLWP